MARAIGPSGRGEAAAALAAFAIAPALLGLGIPLEVQRRFAKGLDSPSLRAARDLVVLSILPGAALGGLFVMTIYRDADVTLRTLAFLGLALLAPVTVSWATAAGAFFGQGRYRAFGVLRIAHPAVTLLVMLLAVGFDALDPATVLAANIAGTTVTGLLGYALSHTTWRGARAPHAKLGRAGARYAGSAVAESASARLDQVLVLPLIGASAAGFYSIAASVAMLPLALGHALSATHFRAMAAAEVSQGDLVQLSRKAMREAASTVIPVCAVFIYVAGEAIPVIFGQDFDSATPVLWVLAPTSVAVALGYVASMLLAAQGRGGTMTLLQGSGLLIGVVALVVLGPLWSEIGAAAASAVSYTAVLVGQMVALRVRASDLLPTFGGFRSGVASLLPARAT